eukprot:7498260-Karenia_brevis.AAC.1
MGVCATNKAKDESLGACTGFISAVPWFGITGADVGKLMKEFVSDVRERLPGAQLVVGFYCGPSNEIAKSEYFTVKTLSYAKYRNALGQPLTMKPYELHVVSASDTASYALCRILPTISSLVLTDGMEKAGVCNWNGQVRAGIQSLRVVVASMPVHYSSQRVQVASLVEYKCLIAVRDGCVFGDSYNCKYEDVLRSLSTNRISKAESLKWWLALNTPPMHFKGINNLESSDSSSSAWKDLEDETRINADLAVLEEFMDLEWFNQSHKIASTQHLLADIYNQICADGYRKDPAELQGFLKEI